MLVIDYTNTTVLTVFVIFFITMNIIGYIKKNAFFNLLTVLVSIAMFVIHFLLANALEVETLKFNVYIDFISLGVNIPLLLIIDEIETRRNVIKEVFENKYNKK